MLIVDAQVHVWGPDTPEDPIVSEPHLAEPLTVDDLLAQMDAAGVDRAALVPPTWQGGFRNALALEAAHRHPERFAVMGRIDIAAPDICEQFARWRLQPGMLGVRISRRQHIEDDGSMDAMLAAAAQHGVPLMLNTPVSASSKMQPIAYMAERFPKLKIAIDHMGVRQEKKGDEAFAELDRLLALARHPNVCVKVTSLPTHATDVWPFTSLHGFFRRVYDAFGPQRLFWGSDLSKLPVPYRECVTMFTEGIPWLTRADREWIMGRALCEWLDWPR